MYVQISVSMNLQKSLNYVIQLIGRSSSLIERIETKGRFKLLSWLSVSVISIVVLVVSIVAIYAKRFKVKMRYYISCIPWKTMASNSQKENSNYLAKKKKILFPAGPSLEGERGERWLPQVFGTYLIEFLKFIYQSTLIR